MSLDRFFKEDKAVPEPISLEGTFIPADSAAWRKPYVISIETIGKVIKLKIDEEALKTRNVSAVKYSDFDTVPELSPESLPIDIRTNLAVDENYLYVWISQVNRWKRIPLSIW